MEADLVRHSKQFDTMCGRVPKDIRHLNGKGI